MALRGVLSSCESVARKSSLVAHALDLRPRQPFALRRLLRDLVEAGVVDGHRRLGCHAHHEALGALGEHAGLRVTEEQPADRLA